MRYFAFFCKNNNLDYFINSILENSKLDEKEYEFLIIDDLQSFSIDSVKISHWQKKII